jgi:hypothetical protein
MYVSTYYDKEKQREYYFKHKERVTQRAKERYRENLIKHREYYIKNKSTIIEYVKTHRKKNIESIKERSKRYRNKNKEHISVQCKEWYERNKDCVIKKSKEYYIKNKKECRKRQCDYINNRLRSEPLYKLMYNVRSYVSLGLKGIVKCAHTQDLLGCTFEELKVYIESKFTEKMSWNNYNYCGWHLDHIKPCAAFDLTDPEQQKQCFHYLNLQPLWAKENLLKNSFYEGKYHRRKQKK